MKANYKIDKMTLVNAKLLFIDSIFHQKTKSSQFILDILRTNFDVDCCYFDGHDLFKEYLVHYDVVVFWQIYPGNEVFSKIDAPVKVFFPMFDNAPLITKLNPRGANYWWKIRDFRIINFCRALHENLKQFGFDSAYFQYFPTIKAKNFEISHKNPIPIFGDIHSLFFWQRGGKIGFNILKKLHANYKLSHIQWHDCPDPKFQNDANPEPSLSEIIQRTTWFANYEEMEEKMLKSALYMAPRVKEGIGMSFLDAMANGRCVIAPDMPTMNEYIKDGENGILYNLDVPVFNLTEKKVRYIQKNALETIRIGHDGWQRTSIPNILNLLKIESKGYNGTFFACSFLMMQRLLYIPLHFVRLIINKMYVFI